MGRQYKDYTGQICGYWKVIERDFHPKSKSHETFWKCECQNCGNIASVRKGNLDQNPLSCNQCKQHIHNPKIWKIGDEYGKLKIVGKGITKNNHTYVKVQCSCGSPEFEVRLEHLKGQWRGKTISCGCAKESSGEIEIRKILEQKNINFQTQYRIKDKDDNLMVFDFVILDESNQITICIEFDGEQHFHPVEYFGGEEAFIKQQERDNRKNKWCKENNIKLIRIPYYDFDKIASYLDFEK